MRRIKLFSSRRKLFSSEPVVYNDGGMILKTLVCRDCGREIETSASTSSIVCPVCGGRRFNVKNIFESPNVAPESVPRKSLFEKDNNLENPSNEYEEKLKKFSGQVIDEGEFQKEFSDSADTMFQRGYAELSDNGIAISSDAYITEKIFSKISITVTKELDLDPDITERRETFPEVIQSLRDSGEVPERGIILIKKAHNPIHEEMFSEQMEQNPEEWIKDSRICEDLRVEYYNTSMGIKQFMSILDSRYPDAPENLLDLLTEKGVVCITGNQVTISK